MLPVHFAYFLFLARAAGGAFLSITEPALVAKGFTALFALIDRKPVSTKEATAGTMPATGAGIPFWHKRITSI
ncbi:MAG: hypothetical protein D6675_14510 [Gemmatimonadetes bacterium]|nr:MAG: hypothetical protein D6675_14510 [Gemmatimonadota bacterium]